MRLGQHEEHAVLVAQVEAEHEAAFARLRVGRHLRKHLVLADDKREGWQPRLCLAPGQASEGEGDEQRGARDPDGR